MYNNNIFNTLFICIVLLFVSCTSANENEDFIAPFRSISGVLINDNDSSILIGSRSSISGVINNAVYIFDPWGEYFFSKYDANKNEFYRFCKRGQGPNESINVLSSVALISKDSLNYISIFDNYYCNFLQRKM